MASSSQRARPRRTSRTGRPGPPGQASALPSSGSSTTPGGGRVGAGRRLGPAGPGRGPRRRAGGVRGTASGGRPLGPGGGVLSCPSRQRSGTASVPSRSRRPGRSWPGSPVQTGPGRFDPGQALIPSRRASSTSGSGGMGHHPADVGSPVARSMAAITELAGRRRTQHYPSSAGPAATRQTRCSPQARPAPDADAPRRR